MYVIVFFFCMSHSSPFLFSGESFKPQDLMHGSAPADSISSPRCGMATGGYAVSHAPDVASRLVQGQGSSVERQASSVDSVSVGGVHKHINYDQVRRLIDLTPVLSLSCLV